MSFLIPPDNSQLEYIKKEPFYRSPAELEEDVTQLIEWLSKQPHLPSVTDRKWLLHFIKGCKFSLQRSKKIIEMYFTVRAEFPEFFGSFTKQELDQSNQLGFMCIFPKLTPQGHRVSCGRSILTSEDDASYGLKYSKKALALLDLQLKNEPIYGDIFLMDLKHFQLSQFLTFTPTLLKNMLRCTLEAFPMRVMSVHYLNPPKFMGRMISFIKIFLPDKIKQRLFVHDSLEELYQYVPKDILPDIYGGTGGKIEQFEEYATKYLLENIEWLEKRPKADLSKLPKHLKSDQLDMNGTFKKLQID